MSKRFAIALTALFVVLTVVYFRQAIFAPLDTWMIRHQGSDIYIYCLGAYERLNMLKEGFLPVGDYWIPRGGGYPSTPQELLVAPAHLLLLAAYTITGSFPLALKILYPLFYLATLFTAYWYGTTILKGKTSPTNTRYASVILAVTYAFCMFGVNTLEQLVFVSVPPLILLTLIFLEKTIKENKPLYIILTSVFLLSVYLTHLYPAYFLTIFMSLRLLFAWKREVLWSAFKGSALLLLMAAPFFIHQIPNMPPQEIKDILLTQTAALALLPGLLFFKGDPMSFLSEASVAYLGLATLVLALTPMMLYRKLEWRRTYIFYLLIALAFVIFAIGQYSPINFASLIQKYLPLSFFLRAPGRAMVIGCLSLSVCAALGFVVLVELIKSKYRTLATLAIVLIIFADLTIGYEPPSMPTPIPQNEAYEFLREQPGDFRIVEVPSIYPQMALSDMYTDHDVLSTYSWAFGYFEPLYTFASQYNNYLSLTAAEQVTALYGVKHVLVNTNPEYYTTLREDIDYYGSPKLEQVRLVADYLNSSESYELVYNRDGYAIYENLLYRGIVFSDEAAIQYVRTDPNTLVIDYHSTKPTTLTISQCYAEGWVATLNNDAKLPIQEFKSLQQIAVPAGTHSVVLHYQNYEKWFITFAVFYAILAVTIVWVWRKHEHN